MRHMIDLFANSEATLMANVFEVKHSIYRKISFPVSVQLYRYM